MFPFDERLLLFRSVVGIELFSKRLIVIEIELHDGAMVFIERPLLRLIVDGLTAEMNLSLRMIIGPLRGFPFGALQIAFPELLLGIVFESVDELFIARVVQRDVLLLAIGGVLAESVLPVVGDGVTRPDEVTLQVFVDERLSFGVVGVDERGRGVLSTESRNGFLLFRLTRCVFHLSAGGVFLFTRRAADVHMAFMRV